MTLQAFARTAIASDSTPDRASQTANVVHILPSRKPAFFEKLEPNHLVVYNCCGVRRIVQV
jgi:hypothetical protein